MFNDMEINREMNYEFKELIKSNHLSVDLSVNVLTSVHWPTQPKMDIVLPDELINCQQIFSE